MNILLSVNGAELSGTSSIDLPDITINLKSTKDSSVVDVSFTTDPESFMTLIETLDKNHYISVIVDGNEITPAMAVIMLNELINKDSNHDKSNQSTDPEG